MAPLPKRKHSSRRQGKRVAARSRAKPTVTECPKCHAPKQPHRVCPKCGYYGV